MRVRITGRHVEVTPALRRYIESRMQRLDRYGLKLGGAQVVLAVEKYRHTAEVVLNLNGVGVQARSSTKEMYGSIDDLFDKISRQIRKHKEKLVEHKGDSPFARRVVPGAETPAKSAPIKSVRLEVPSLTVAEAVGRLGSQPSAIVIFVNAASDRLQLLRRLENGDAELIDPQPV
ncbi:MAG: ribosome-associated translation inhibitor RaiA [Nitrospirota bacterium]